MISESISILNVQDALQKLDSEMYPSEVHGNVCGFLCSNSEGTAQSWLISTFKQYDPENLLHQESKSILEALFTSSQQQLNDPEFAFYLLLPDDDSELSSRVVALSEWCQGFLVGLSMAGIEELKRMPENAIEVATDMTEIARADSSYEITGDDGDEEAFQELVEYIRIGALLIQEELRASDESQTDTRSIH